MTMVIKVARWDPSLGFFISEIFSNLKKKSNFRAIATKLNKNNLRIIGQCMFLSIYFLYYDDGYKGCQMGP